MEISIQKNDNLYENTHLAARIKRIQAGCSELSLLGGWGAAHWARHQEESPLIG